jgi:hypothetical protein
LLGPYAGLGVCKTRDRPDQLRPGHLAPVVVVLVAKPAKAIGYFALGAEPIAPQGWRVIGQINLLYPSRKSGRPSMPARNMVPRGV